MSSRRGRRNRAERRWMARKGRRRRRTHKVEGGLKSENENGKKAAFK